MSTFKVGSRVRLVRPVVATNMGATGVVTHIGPWTAGDVLPSGRRYRPANGDGVVDCYVKWDMPLTDALGNVASGLPSKWWRLEPIVPDGHRSGDYSYTELMDRLKAGEGVPA